MEIFKEFKWSSIIKQLSLLMLSLLWYYTCVCPYNMKKESATY